MMEDNLLKKKQFKSALIKLFFALLVLIPILTYSLYTAYTNPKPRIVTTPESSNYMFEAQNSVYKAKLGQKGTGIPIIQFQTNKGKSIEFAYVSESQSGQIQTETKNRSILFNNVEQMIDLEYIMLENGVKENIILREKVDKTTFYFKTNTHDLVIKKHYTEAAPSFYDENGSYLFNIEKGYAVDALGKRTENVQIDLVKDPDGQPYIRVRIDPKWLNSPSRRYPVRIDPTLVHDTTSEFSEGQFNRIKDTGSGSSPILQTYYQPPNSDLSTVGLWHFDEPSGNVLDSSGYSQTGTPTGTTVDTSSILGNARIFNGTSDYITVNDTSELRAVGAITIEVWIKSTGSNDYSGIVYKRVGNNGYQMGLNTNGGVRADLYNGSTWATVTNSTNVEDGQWHHVATTYDGISALIYVDGKPGNPLQATSYVTSSAANLLIGNDSGAANRFFNGEIDEVRISNRARSAEEIKLDAQKRPYSTFTSNVLDLADVISWNSLSWSELGVNTGGGETLKDSSNVVAHWKLNETSGTSANNDAEGTSCGGTPGNCDGTLIGVDSTTSQDSDLDSSWTANNRRWGEGALQLDGVNSYVEVADNNAISFGNGVTDTPFSICSWINPISATSFIIAAKQSVTADIREFTFSLRAEEDLSLILFDDNGANQIEKVSNIKFAQDEGQWVYVCSTYDGSGSVNGIKLYRNGIQLQTFSDNAGTYTAMSNTAQKLFLGWNGTGGTTYAKGMMDSTYMYQRELSASEILSNYNTGNINIQTRVGTDSTQDDGSWEEWKPNSSETAIESMDLSSKWSVPNTNENILLNDSNEADVGDGADGALSPSGTFNLNTSTSGSRTYADGIAYQIASNPTGNSIVTVDTPNGIAAGDEILLINLRGSTTDFRDAGNYEFLEVQSVNSGTKTITTTNPIQKPYGGNTFSNQKVAIQRVPNYTSVTLDSTDSITSSAWDAFATTPTGSAGYQTGIVAFRANGTVTIGTGTTISTNYLGYLGGNTTTIGGKGGEAYCGDGGAGSNTEGVPGSAGAAGGGGYGGTGVLNPTGNAGGAGSCGGGGGGGRGGNAGSGSTTRGGAGGGGGYKDNAAGQTGAGGGAGYGNPGTGGGGYGASGGTGGFDVSGNGGTDGGGGGGGGTYGDYQLNRIYLGAGGGMGGSNGGTGSGVGGKGGGIIFISANTLTNSGSITSNGQNGSNGSTSFKAPGGGGAGGSIFIRAMSVTLGTNGATAAGGSGGTLYERVAGNGGKGRIKLVAQSLTGTSDPQATINQISSSNVKQEGSSSISIKSGQLNVDSFTTSLWHLDETGGNGAYLKDSTNNSNHLTPTGTVPEKGISQKSRDLNGTSDFMSISSPTGLPSGSSARTIELWVKPDNTNPGGALVHWGDGTGGGQEFALQLGTISGTCYLFSDGINGTNNITISGAEIPANGRWSHIAFTKDLGSNWKYYLNGTLTKSGSFAVTINTSTPNILNIGERTDVASNNFPGLMDEIRISNIERTAREVAEDYRAGRDHYLNLNLNSANLNTQSTLPFYIAADKPGTYLESIVGESAYANNLTDGNTLGLWHLEEQSGAGAFLKDSSGNENNGTPTSLTMATGKIGKARSFVAGTNYINLGSPSAYGGLTAFTIEAWIYPTSVSGQHRIFDRGSSGSPNVLLLYQESAAIRLLVNNTDLVTTSDVLTVNQWYHVVAVYTGSGGEKAIYVNGVKVATGTSTQSSVTAGSLATWIGCPSWGTCSTYVFNGIIDEVRLSNVARSSESIRQAYEINRRSHNITIDFGAALHFSNLITSSSDTSFTIDATYYGLQNKGSNLYLGDKIIVQENYDGTVYTAQGTVSSVNTSTGAVLVSGWENGSTFPPTAGFSSNASVFKWQREYWPLQNVSQDSHIDTTSVFTLRFTDGSEGRNVWIDDLKSSGEYLTTPTGSAIASSVENRYIQYKALLISGDYNTSPSLSTVELDWDSNSLPGVPTLDTPTNLSVGNILKPALKTTATDADLDYLRYKIVLCQNVDMTIGCQTFNQTLSQTGWSGQNAEGNTAYSSGTQATYTLQSDLKAGGTYYWKSYAIDPGGRNDWGYSQTSPYHFGINSKPRSTNSNEVQSFIARRESSFPSLSTGWTSITGSAESGTTASSNGWIAGTNFTVGDQYLLMVWGEHQADNVGSQSGIRVTHGGTPFSESETVEQSDQTDSSHKTPYYWFTVWTATNEAVETEVYWSGTSGSEARVEDVTLVALNVTDLIDNNYFKYNISNTGGTLNTSYAQKAHLSFSPSNNNDLWWIMGYSKADVVSTAGSKYQAQLNIDGQNLSHQVIKGVNASDTPLYGLGHVAELTTDTHIIDLELKESLADQEWDSAGVFALNLSYFDSYLGTTKTGTGTSMSTPSNWVGQTSIDPISQYQGRYIIAGGGVVADAGGRVIGRIQNSGSNITDDAGGWSHDNADYQPLTLGDVQNAYTIGLKSLTLDTQTTQVGTSWVEDAWMVGFSLEKNGNGPQLNLPADNATNQSVRTQLKLTAIDPNNDTLKYKIELCQNEAMTLSCQTFDQTATQTGWSGQNAASFTRYTSGTQATYTLQTDLAVNTEYFWRGYAKDLDGTNTFSSPSSIFSFTTTVSPNAPTSIEIEGTASPQEVTDTTPEFSAIHTDTNSDAANYYEVEVNTLPTFAGTIKWDSGKTAMTSTPSTNRSPLITYAGSSLSVDGSTYYLRIRFWDTNEAVSPWSATSSFRMDALEIPLACRIIDSDSTDTTIQILWTDTNTVEDGYKIQRSVNGGAFGDLISKPADSTSHSDSISAGNTYRYRIAATLSPFTGSWCTTSTADVHQGSMQINGNFQIGGITFK